MKFRAASRWKTPLTASASTTFLLVKVASTAVVAEMLGLTREEILNAVSLAWVDGQSLRTYRHAPNTGTRKSGRRAMPLPARYVWH